MPRKPIVRSRENYYHVTARSNNRDFFNMSLDETWQIMTDKLAMLQGHYKIKIAAFVLMNNHFHLLVLTPNEDIDRIMYFFMKDVTIEIQKRTGRINKIFGGRYKGSIITNFNYLVNVYKYIYRNPVEVNICDNAESYKFSTLHFRYTPNVVSPFKIEILLPKCAFDEFDDLDELRWLNQKYEILESESIKCGLQKTVFAYEKDKINNRPIVPVVRHPKRKSQEQLWNELFN